MLRSLNRNTAVDNQVRVNTNRVRIIKSKRIGAGPVVYWMSRDQRVKDNWSLIYAQELAIQHGQPLAVIFCLVPEFLGATLRQYSFMLGGLEEVERLLANKNIPFFLLQGKPGDSVPGILRKIGAGCLIADFDPLRIKTAWKSAVARHIDIAFHEVDAHNIIPAWITSRKQEFAAHTIRRKIERLLPEYLDAYPSLKRQHLKLKERAPGVQWKKVLEPLPIDRSVAEVDWIRPGEKAARKALSYFIAKRLVHYDELRNNPVSAGTSDLSPYLHFGHISAQRVALKIKESSAPRKAKDSFLEELIVRRELADNFCLYNRYYDSVKGFPLWGQKTLHAHGRDKREHLYGYGEFESALTHDPLWNAAQLQMVRTGKMHGYMRMYWCKKILEWSRTPEEALRTAIGLNDTYELDGRDPNGYTGIAWSIGGLHDRPWMERKVFGKIRFMSYNGCRKKFDIAAYIKKFQEDRI
jgi:deoxyribodipyrimidine photo-lyase